MGTTLTGTTPQDTYDSLIKVTDNGPLSGTLKALSDGLGNDSTLSLSTTAASIAGTLAVSGNATFDTTTLVVDATNNRVGVGTASPAVPLHTVGTVELNGSLYRSIFGGSSAQDADMTGLSGGNGSEVQIQSPSTTRGSYLTIGGGLANSEALGGIGFYNSNNTDGKRLRSYLLAAQEGATANEQGGYLSFGTAADSVAVPSERMRIKSGGSMDFSATDAVTEYNFGYNRPTASNLLVNGTNNNKIRIQNSESDIVVLNSNGDSYFNGGNVGIGTSAPSTRLTVDNSATATTRAIDLVGNSSTAKGHLGYFANSVYLSSNYFFESGQNYDVSGLGQAAIVVAADTVSASKITFSTSAAGATAPTVRASIDADGLKFNGDTLAANALDDYEEGTFDFGIAFGGASVGVTYSLRGGTYTKIGRQVTVNGLIQLTNKGSSTGNATITGLPFTVANTFGNYSSASLRFSNVTFANQFQAFTAGNTTIIELEEVTEAGVTSALTNADIADNAVIIVSLTYFV
jgi:hypothetical protein